MIGASRTSMAALREAVNARFDAADEAALAADGESVLSFAALLGRERTLRQTLADPAMNAGAKVGLLNRLLDGKVTAGALELVGEIVNLRWSTDRDMVAAMDEAGQRRCCSWLRRSRAGWTGSRRRSSGSAVRSTRIRTCRWH